MDGGPGLVGVLRRLRGWALDFAFPPHCAGCGREGAYLCAPCLAGARRLEDPYRLARGGSIGGELALSPIALDAVYAPFVMEGPVREAVHQLKYRGVRALAPILGEAMAECADRNRLAADLIAPVPLHPRRLRERGYNQADLLAGEVARRMGIPADSRALERTTHAPPQARSAASAERWARVQGAYRARRTMDGLRVLVVDDVCTTGATLNACALALRSAGAAAVWGLVAAREL